MHTLSSELAIEAVSKVGTAVFNVWQGKSDYTVVKDVVNNIMKHPAQTTWQSAIVKKWKSNNKKLVCGASKPSVAIDRLVHVNVEIRELLTELEKTAQKPAFKKINSYREKLYKEAKDNNKEEFKTFEGKLAEIKDNIIIQEKALKGVQKKWDAQFPEPLICRIDGPTTTYTVQPRDTLSEIAERGSTTVRDLLELNPSIDPGTKTIYPGYNLVVPNPIWVDLTPKKPFLD